MFLYMIESVLCQLVKRFSKKNPKLCQFHKPVLFVGTNEFKRRNPIKLNWLFNGCFELATDLCCVCSCNQYLLNKLVNKHCLQSPQTHCGRLHPQH